MKLDSPLKQAYQSSFSCSSLIAVHDGKIKSRYCKRQWCKICGSIRTAIRLNKYKKQLHELGTLHLTTLTIPNVTADKIKPTLQLFRKVFLKFRDKKRKQNIDFSGVYNFEITYNAKTNLFHPHIHIIHSELEMQLKENYTKKSKYKNELIDYWLQNTKDFNTNILAQDTRIVTDLIEGFKYQALSVYKNKSKQIIVPVKELDQIYQAIKSVRMFNSFGNIKALPDEEIEKEMDSLESYNTEKAEGAYLWKVNDWHHTHDENYTLSDYKPTKKFLKYVQKIKENKHYQS